MAFSQKHSRKVLVPWFNTAEWRSVYNFITSNSKEQMETAVDILKIWKCRTPLLSAGVEGTLLLLEAILSDLSNLSDFQIVQIYSTALLRFLNICAANSNKQGSFNKTVQRNDLPKWLIDIRHDIAHGHKLPSKSLLELALNQSFEWLIEKYWRIQNESISDYVAEVENPNAKILDCLNVYVRLNMNLYKKVDMNEYDEALMEKVNYLVSKRYNKSRTDAQGLLIILEEIMKQAFSDPDNNNLANKVAQCLVDEKAFLATYIGKSDDGNEIIPKTFRDLWLNLLNILFENERYLVALLNQFSLAINNARNEIIQKIASIWISDIFVGLLKAQSLDESLQSIAKQDHIQSDLIMSKITVKSKLENKYPEYKDSIEFVAVEKVSLVNVKGFEDEILKTHSSYTIKFIDKVMKFNKNPHRKLIVGMLNDMYGNVFEKINMNNFSEIYTVNDLLIPENNSTEIIENHLVEKNEYIVMDDEHLSNGRRWKLLKNTSMYRNCPLGVLPGQKQPENHLII